MRTVRVNERIQYSGYLQDMAETDNLEATLFLIATKIEQYLDISRTTTTKKSPRFIL